MCSDRASTPLHAIYLIFKNWSLDSCAFKLRHISLEIEIFV